MGAAKKAGFVDPSHKRTIEICEKMQNLTSKSHVARTKANRLNRQLLMTGSVGLAFRYPLVTFGGLGSLIIINIAKVTGLVDKSTLKPSRLLLNDVSSQNVSADADLPKKIN